jgi:hypothetical protein
LSYTGKGERVLEKPKITILGFSLCAVLTAFVWTADEFVVAQFLKHGVTGDEYSRDRRFLQNLTALVRLARPLFVGQFQD